MWARTQRNTSLVASCPPVTVAITKDTLVKKDDKPGTLADVKVDLKVEIKAKRDKDGKLTAVVIKIEEHEDEHED